MYKVGDKVVYPHHGAGTVVKREKREVLGEKREYLTIKILHNDMTVNVPAENAERVGLRKVIDEEAVKKVVKYLTSGGTEMPKNWNRRFKHNRDKMKTGDIYELAEVVRNLALRDGEKGLSTGEKQMYVKAKKILASELMYAKTMSEDEALEWLEETLTNGAKPKVTPAERKAAATAARPAATARRPRRSPRRPRRRRRSRLPRARSSRARRQELGREDSRRREEEDHRREVSVWAVLVAAGRGERLGEDRPKAFVRLGDLPLLAEPLRRLDECEWIDARRRRRASRLGGAGDPARRGGRRVEGRRVRDRRRDAHRLGARRRGRGARGRGRDPRPRRRPAAAVDAGVVAAPDRGARPRASTAPSRRLPVSDTVKRVAGGVVAETLDRAELVTVQTPQAFVASVLRSALDPVVPTWHKPRTARRSSRRPAGGDDGGRRRAAAQGDDAGRPRAGGRHGCRAPSCSTSARR